MIEVILVYDDILVSGIVFLGWMFHSLVSIALSES